MVELERITVNSGNEEARGKRSTRRQFINNTGLAAVAYAVGIAGCGQKPEFNISPYFGMTREEIIGTLGNPSGEGRPSFSTTGNLAYVTEDPNHMYWLEEKLHSPFTLLQIRFSESGLCNQVLGTFQPGYETPEDVLNVIGFRSLEKERTSSDQLGFDYRMPPFEMVHVSRPASNIARYTDFTIWDEEAGNPR